MSSKGQATETSEYFLPHLPAPGNAPGLNHTSQWVLGPHDTGGRGRGGGGIISPPPQGKKRFLVSQQPPPFQLRAPRWTLLPSGEGPLFACGSGDHGCCLPAYRASPAQPRRTAGGRRTRVSPDPFRLSGWLPTASPPTGPQSKETGQRPTFSGPAPIPQSHPSGNLCGFGSLCLEEGQGGSFLKTPPFLSLGAYL